jgi:rhomboid protease GluP
MFLLFLIVVITFGIYSMKPEERAKGLRTGAAAIHRLRDDAVRRMQEPEPHVIALRARTRWPFVTAALVLLHVVIYFRMALADGPIADSATLLAWGGNFGPLTSNGEWWRLIAATFIHTSLLQLLVNMAALAQVGLLLERLVGHATFVLVYVVAAVIGSALDLYASPLSTGSGPAAALMAVYGLLAGSTVWSLLQPTASTIPLPALKRLAPIAVLFLLSALVSGDLTSKASIVGFVIGLVAGLALAKGIGERKPSLHLVGPAAAIAMTVAIGVAFPLRGISDVRPEIERIVELEGRAAGIYESAVKQFRLGAIRAEALAQIIDRSIMPELHAAQGRMKGFEGDNIPSEHRPLVEGANEYLRLRDESWRQRADALRKSNMNALRQADRTEWESLEAFNKIKPVEKTAQPDQQPEKPPDKQ